MDTDSRRNIREACRIGLVLLLTFFFAATAVAQPAGKKFVPGELLVKVKTKAAKGNAEKAIQAAGGTVLDEIAPIKVKRIRVPEHALEKVKKALQNNPNFEFAEPNYLTTAAAVPNDSSYGSQWHLPKIQAPLGWDISTGSVTEPIAVIDSGVDTGHSDLAGKLVPGYNFADYSTNTDDVYGHGTAVAGSAAAISNNSSGVAGVSWDNPIMPLLVLDSSGYATYSRIANAITFAVDNGARVINISLGATSSSYTLQSAVDYAWSKGAIIVAAAGNYANSTPCYPAACDKVIAVSASDKNDNLASFSNFGDWIDVASPGYYIYTTNDGGGYGSWNGTSFSSPIAAGAVALIWSVNPALTNQEVVNILFNSADDLGEPGFDVNFGHGRINVEKALKVAQDFAPAPDTAAPSVSITTPSDGETVEGPVSVSVSASDDTGVAKVELFVNGALFATDSSAPYAFGFDSTIYADTWHTLTARAFDAAGNTGQSADVKILVSNPQDTTAPAVDISSPAEGATVSASVAVAATASDNTGIEKVEFFLDGALVATDTSASYGYSWDTRSATDGWHTLSAKAYDPAGNIGQATTVNVLVSNPQDATAPVATITYPLPGASLNKHEWIEARASDDNKVERIELYIDGSLESVTYSDALSSRWMTHKEKRGSHTLTVRAFDSMGNVGVDTITVYK